METEKPKLRLHGECVAFTSAIPYNVKQLSPDNCNRFDGSSLFRLNESSESNNYHCVEVKPSCEFYQDDAGTCYMRSETPTRIVCTQSHRHKPVNLPAGSYVFGVQQVFDPFEARLRAVAD